LRLANKDVKVNLAKDVFWSHPPKLPYSVSLSNRWD